MHYIGLALYAEGKTDYYFLRPVLLRLTTELCLQAPGIVELAEEVIGLDHPSAAADLPRPRRIVEAAKLARGAWRILFVHADGAGDPEQARQTLIAPAIELLIQEYVAAGVAVAVVPVRETEAWALVDGSALRGVFGCTLTDDQMGLPSMRAVETEQDPKRRLEQAFEATHPSARRRRQGVAPLLNALGETVSLDALRKLSSFQALEAEVRAALRTLKVLR